MSALYAPGRAAAIVTERALVVVDRALEPAGLARLWSELAADLDLAGVLSMLAEVCDATLTSLPSFAVVLAEGDGVRIALRGSLMASDGDANIDGAGVSTWTERLLPGTTSVSVSLEDAADGEAALPMRAGVVFVSSIRWASSVREDSGAPAPGRRAARSASIPPVPVPPAMAAPVPPVAEAPVVVAPIAAVPPTRSTALAAAAALIDSAAVSAAAAHHDTADTLLPSETVTASDTSEPAPAADPTVDTASTTGYDHLWGETIVRSVEEAAVRPAEEGESTASDEAFTSAEGDHDGATISIAQARAMRGERHEAIPPLAPPRLPAPARIRLSTGQMLTLDRTVVIGRRPRSTRVTGTDLPHLVAVDSPQQDISRSHLELRVDAGAIVATDLHTTNGSMLLRSGADPVRLHPGESTVVVVGDVIDLGDGVTITVEELS